MSIKRILFLILFIATISSGQSRIDKSDADTLCDVFPLSIGNQWTYDYYYQRIDGDTYFPIDSICCDTGTVHLQVINNIVSSDSIQWFIREEKSLWYQDHYPGPFVGPSITADTFTIVESLSGNHKLYRIDTFDNLYVYGNVYREVIPIPYDLHDSAKVYRYSRVDSAGVKTIMALASEVSFVFSFKSGVGLSSIEMGSLCGCMSSSNSHHTLRNSVLTGITNGKDNLFLKTYRLYQNYPNPFNPSTNISFDLPLRSFVTLKIFDLLGKEVASIVSETLSAGSYSRQWNASGLPSGVYFYRLQAGSFTESRKLIVLK